MHSDDVSIEVLMRGHIACAPVLSRITINHADVFKVDDSSYCSFSIVAIDILKVIFFYFYGADQQSWTKIIGTEMKYS